MAFPWFVGAEFFSRAKCVLAKSSTSHWVSSPFLPLAGPSLSAVSASLTMARSDQLCPGVAVRMSSEPFCLRLAGSGPGVNFLTCTIFRVVA